MGLDEHIWVRSEMAGLLKKSCFFCVKVKHLTLFACGAHNCIQTNSKTINFVYSGIRIAAKSLHRKVKKRSFLFSNIFGQNVILKSSRLEERDSDSFQIVFYLTWAQKHNENFTKE